LSIFVGGCSMESILEVCEGIEDEFDLLDDLTVLIDNSLVVSVDSGNRQRFTLLELIKEFGLEQLEENQKLDSLKRNHLRYFTFLAQKGAKELSGPDRKSWSAILFKERPNFRAAISYALEIEEMQYAYDLGISLRAFWGSRGMLMEGVSQLEIITSKEVPEHLHPEKLKALQALGGLYLYIPRPEKAIPILEESYAYWRKKSDKSKLGHVLNDLGWANIVIGNYIEGEKYSLKGKEIFETLQNKAKLVSSHNNLGSSFMNRGRPTEAYPHFTKCLELTKQLNDDRRKAYALLNLGLCDAYHGNYDLSISRAKQGIVILHEINDKTLETYGYDLLSFTYLYQGDFVNCYDACIKTEILAKEANAVFAIADSYTRRAFMEIHQNKLKEAKDILEKIEKIAEKKTSHAVYANYFKAMAYLTIKMNDLEQAKLFGKSMLEGQLPQGDFLSLIPALEIGAIIANKEEKFESAATLLLGSQRVRAELTTPIQFYEKKDYLNLQQLIEERLSAEVLASIKSKHLSLEELANISEEIFLS
ncbi:MAG: tetratricopeptide repeat protein, partial [Bacteroidota bacterium]